MKLWDVSPRIDADLKVWPGDTPMSREVLCELEKGASVTLSTLRATVHLGSHADGPNHYGRGAPGIEAMPLERYLGPCHVLDAPVSRATRVRIDDVRWPVGGLSGSDAIVKLRHPRVLLKTGTYPDRHLFNEDFAGLEPSLIDALVAHGTQTIGVDTPSVDLFSSKDLPAHAACLRGEVAILEGLVLRDVPAGEYELIALPLRLVGFDASPVRAVLREWRTSASVPGASRDSHPSDPD